jgi:hypothetical protein
MRHAPGYRERARETPVLDAIGSVIAVASVVIGSYALLFLVFAVHMSNGPVAVQCGLFLGVIAVVNALFEALRRWRRHHG